MVFSLLSLFSLGGAAKEVVVQTNRRDPYGLHILYPQRESQDPALGTTDIDIIAVHGLDGDPWTTWTHEISNRNWLEDFLPKKLPNARIMTFGYNSHTTWSNSVATIEHFAKELLSRIRQEHREVNASEDRPLIFICHSLGGIVVKKALVLAHEDEDRFGFIKRRCKGVVFLGTPHQGSKAADLAGVLSIMVNGLTLSAAIRTTLINDLRSNSSVLQDISRQFIQRAKLLQIKSFYETEFLGVGSMSVTAVDERSASLGLPNEETFPMNANHRDICKFSHEGCQKYLFVRAEIVDMVKWALQAAVRPVTEVPVDIRSDEEELRQRIIEWLDPEPIELSGFSERTYEARIEEMEKNTCDWFWRNDRVKAWLSGDSSILWVHGGPGTGKSVLCSSIISKLADTDPPKNLAYFFCTFSQSSETDPGTTSPKPNSLDSILRSLVVQLLQSMSANPNNPLPEKLKALYHQHKRGQSSKPCPNGKLKYILHWILNSLPSTYIIIDGLDEVEELGATNLKQVEKLFKALEFVPLGIVKWLFISQKTKEVDYSINHFSEFQTESARATYQEIDLADTEVNDEMQAEIMNMFRRNLQEKFSEDYRRLEEYILQTLVRLTGNNFLCAKLLLDDLRNCPSIEDVFSSIFDYEPGLHNQYLRALRRMNSIMDTRWTNAAKKALMYVVLSLKPLSIYEVKETLCIDVQVTDPEQCKKLWIDSDIKRLCLPLVTVCPKKLTLKPVHHSVRAFLLKQLGDPKTWNTNGIDDYFIDEKKGNMHAALICLSYLRNSRYSSFEFMNEHIYLHRSPSPEQLTGLSRLSMQDECQTRKDALLKYAAIFWHRHADNAEQMPDLVEAVKDFIKSPNFITCLRIQSLYAPYHFGSYVSKDNFAVAYADTIPGWLESDEFSNSNGKEMAFQYHTFVKEWGHVLGRYPGEIERCLIGTLGNIFFSEIKPVASSYLLCTEGTVQSADAQTSYTTSIADLENDGWILTLKTKSSAPSEATHHTSIQALEMWHYDRHVNTIPSFRWLVPDISSIALDSSGCPLKFLNCCDHPLKQAGTGVEWPAKLPSLIASQNLDFIILNGYLFCLRETGGTELQRLRSPLINIQFPTIRLTPLGVCMSTSAKYVAIAAVWECDMCEPKDDDFIDEDGSGTDSSEDSDLNPESSVFIGTGFVTEPYYYGFFKLVVYNRNMLKNEKTAPMYEFGGHCRRIPGENPFQPSSPAFHPFHPLVSWAPGFGEIISADLSTGFYKKVRNTKAPQNSNVIARELHYSECGGFLYEVKITLKATKDAPFHSGWIYLTTYPATDINNPGNTTQRFRWKLDRPAPNFRVFHPPTITWTAENVYMSFSNIGLSIVRIDLSPEGARLFVTKAGVALPTSALQKAVRFVPISDKDAIIALGGSQGSGPSLILAEGLLYWEEKDWLSRIDLSLIGGGKAGVFYECDEPSYIVAVRSDQVWTDRVILECS